jgi:hypothetical protein
MTKTSGRSAFLFAAGLLSIGLLAGLALPSHAYAEDAPPAAVNAPTDAQPAGAVPVSSQMAAPDQPNVFDSAAPAPAAASTDTAPAATTAQTDAPAAPRPAPVMASSSNDHSTWDETSLIGKIFIGFGALLTLASAARMFMA